MKLHLYIYAILLSLLIGCQDEILTPDKLIEEEVLVKTEEACRLISEVSEDPNNWHFSFTRDLEYNAKGLLVKELIARKDESLDLFEYVYDSKNNLIEKTEYSKGIKIRETKHTYDSKNRLIGTTDFLTNLRELFYTKEFTYHNNDTLKSETTIMHPSGDSSISTSTYDQEGKILEQNFNGQVNKYEYEGDKLVLITQSEGESIFSTTEQMYSSKGLISHIIKRFKGEIQQEWIYSYDDLENLVLLESFYQKRAPNERTSYQYSGKELKSRKTEDFYRDNWVTISEFTYQENNPIKRLWYKTSGDLSSTTIYTYNSFNKLIHTRVDYSSGSYFESKLNYTCQ